MEEIIENTFFDIFTVLAKDLDASYFLSKSPLTWKVTNLKMWEKKYENHNFSKRSIRDGVLIEG